MTTGVAKLTISLPWHLKVLTDEIAQERKVSRSKVVTACLQEMAERRKLAEMEEGYRVMAEEHSNFANMALAIAHEVLPKETIRL